MGRYDGLTDQELIALGESANESMSRDELADIACAIIKRVCMRSKENAPSE